MPAFAFTEIVTATLLALTILLVMVAHWVSREEHRGIAARLALVAGTAASLVLLASFNGVADRWLDPSRDAGLGAGRSLVDAGLLTRRASASSTAGVLDLAPFRDCAACPEMKVLPAGYVMVGGEPGDAAANPAEQPRRKVQLRKPFAIGRYEITVGQYAAFLAATGHRPPGCNVALEAERRLPVHCIAWTDARRYAAWLSERTNQLYRLPTAAEWEYAARAGSAAAVPRPAAADAPPDTDGATRQPNAFGLFEMAGSVAELVRDCWSDTLAAMPTDGTAAIATGCRTRVLKDGAWNEAPATTRPSARRPVAEDAMLAGVGFRLVREMR